MKNAECPYCHKRIEIAELVSSECTCPECSKTFRASVRIIKHIDTFKLEIKEDA